MYYTDMIPKWSSNRRQFQIMLKKKLACYRKANNVHNAWTQRKKMDGHNSKCL